MVLTKKYWDEKDKKGQKQVFWDENGFLEIK